MRLPAIALLLALASCQSPDPGIEVRTVEVVKEVPKPCPGKVPERPAKLGPLPSDPIQALALVGAKLAEYAAPGKYADQAEAYFEVCPPGN